MGKEYSIHTVFNEEQLGRINEIADKANSLQEAKKDLEKYFSTLQDVIDRGFDSEHLSFQVSNLVAKLYERRDKS